MWDILKFTIDFPLWVLNILILAIHSQLNTATYYYLTKHFLGNRMILKEYFYYYSVAAVRVWEFDERLKIYPAEEKAFLKCIFPWNNRLFSPHPSFAWKYHCNSGEFHKQSPQNNRASKQSAICTYPKRYDVKECATRGVYWVNLKFKDSNSIDKSLFTYLCMVIWISADGCILWQA